MSNSDARVEARELLERAERFRKAGDLSGAEACLSQALQFDPADIDVLQVAASFYETAAPNPEKAREYAAKCRDRAAAILSEMDRILGSQRKKQPPARHIGGIIGPY